jgi:hypothetical protein
MFDKLPQVSSPSKHPVERKPGVYSLIYTLLNLVRIERNNKK